MARLYAENPTVLPNGYGRKDPQEEEVYCYCAGCGGEIYRKNKAIKINGDYICKDSDCALAYCIEIGFDVTVGKE
jgi:hypothetical protein